MFKKNPLAAAISSIAAASAMSMAGPALAQGAPALEEIIVVGSRIPRDVSDTPRPVTIVTRADIDQAGIKTVAEAMRYMPYNTRGSARERSGDSINGTAFVNLRGLGRDRTAVLINGRRVPGNPLDGSAAVDLNTIPLEAVERIEILTDSASAIYGADAIGGVVNVVMREDYDGVDLTIGTEQPSRDGAQTDFFSMTFGASNDKGSVLFAAEWFKRDPIFDADRSYSRVNVMDNPNGGLPRHDVDTTGVSGFGNTFLETDDSASFPAGPCPTDTYIPISNPFGVPGPACGFGYADLSMQTGGYDRISTFLNAHYEMVPGHDIYLENRFTDKNSIGRYAPVAGAFLVADDAPLNPTLGTPEQRNLVLLHRFTAHGNRDDTVSVREVDAVLGVRGAFANDAVNYDAYARHYNYSAPEVGRTYVITSIIEDLVASGDYNFVTPMDPSNADAVNLSAATLHRDIETEVTEFAAKFDGFVFDLSAGQMGWAAGAEVAKETYQDVYDRFREAMNTLGSGGNTARGNRKRWALFGEVSIPVIDTLEVGVASRYDDYDDVGSEFSPQISVRWQPIDSLVVRASWGEGFKAPNLNDLHSELAFSSETVTDLLRCDAQGVDEASCPDSQVEEYTGGNPELVPEQSESFNIGVVVTPIEPLSISLDWYRVKIDDAVETLDLQDVLELERLNQLPTGVIVNRSPTINGVPGVITRCEGSPLSAPDCGLINVFGNLATKEVQGLDFRFHYDLETNRTGTFAFHLEWAHLLKFDEVALPGGATFDRPGTRQFPENRATFNALWSMGQFNVNYVFRWIDATDGVTAGSRYPKFSTHDLIGIWHAPFNGMLTVGIRNIGNEKPSIDSVSGWDDEVSLELYDVAGRVPFITYRHSF
ncbi:MAG: TonB-dependent receptor [Gammaproteobacteria bacterium]|nr:TonB-dependent receptor [Gammaproteobacteria bacterium]